MATFDACDNPLEDLFGHRDGERQFACVFPLKVVSARRFVLLGLKDVGPGKGTYGGFGGDVEEGEGLRERATRALQEQCHLQALPLRPCAEIVVVFDGALRTRHHIFLVHTLSEEPSESDEMTPRWFDAEHGVPFERLPPDAGVWLPQVLQDDGLVVRGYFEVSSAALRRAQLLPPAIPRATVPSALESGVRRAVERLGAMFDFEFAGSRHEFNILQRWSWASTGSRVLRWAVAPAPKRLAPTADTANRLRDKARVEGTWGLAETGSRGLIFRDSDGAVVATGYEAVVYGDHGPYVEFVEAQICWQIFQWHVLKGPKRTHFEHYNGDRSIKLYGQFNTVGDQPNPPPGPFSASNNRRDGYADYRVGYFYLSPDAFFSAGGSVRMASSVSVDLLSYS